MQPCWSVIAYCLLNKSRECSGDLRSGQVNGVAKTEYQIFLAVLKIKLMDSQDSKDFSATIMDTKRLSIFISKH